MVLYEIETIGDRGALHYGLHFLFPGSGEGCILMAYIRLVIVVNMNTKTTHVLVLEHSWARVMTNFV